MCQPEVNYLKIVHSLISHFPEIYRNRISLKKFNNETLTVARKFIFTIGPPRMNTSECPMIIKLIDKNFIPQIDSRFISFRLQLNIFWVVWMTEKHFIISLTDDFSGLKLSMLYAWTTRLCRRHRRWSPVARAMNSRKHPTTAL